MTISDRNRMYDALDSISKEFPEANLQLIAIGLGAEKVEMNGDVLNITLEDGSGFAFISA